MTDLATLFMPADPEYEYSNVHFFCFVLAMRGVDYLATLYHTEVQSAQLSYAMRGLSVTGDDHIYITMLRGRRLPQ